MNLPITPDSTTMSKMRARLRPFQLFTLFALFVLPSAPGCSAFESVEQRQVRLDRARERRGEALKYHKDPIELSEHAMALRLQKNGSRPMGATPPAPGGKYEFRPNGIGVEYGKTMPNGQIPSGVVPASGTAPGRLTYDDPDEPARE